MILMIAVAVSLAAGTAYGRWATVRSLLIGASNHDRTPHKMGERFYYLVPEREYIDLRLRSLRLECQEPPP